MSEILTVYWVATEEERLAFASEEEAAAFIQEQILGGSNTLGTHLTFDFLVGEMEQSQFAALPEAEG